MVLLIHFEAIVIQSFCISEFYTWSPVYLAIGEEDSSVIDIERPKPEHVYIK